MKRLEPVIGAKGTLMTRQHLQIQDRFLSLRLTSPVCAGVAALASGVHVTLTDDERRADRV
jgi:hypothetical protein